MARPPKPTALVLVEKRNHRKKNKEEPKPRPEPIHMPKVLDVIGRREWKRIVPILKEIKVLTSADYIVLGILCEQLSLWERAASRLNSTPLLYESPGTGHLGQHPLVSIVNRTTGEISRLSQQLGLTPSARSTMRVEDAAASANEKMPISVADDALAYLFQKRAEEAAAAEETEKA